MLEFQQKKKIRKWLYSKTMIAGLCLILVLGLDALWNIHKKEALSSANLAAARQSYERLEERHTTLTKEIDRLATPAGIEEEIRNKFAVVKEGEEVAIIVDAASPRQPEQEVTQKPSLWKRFLDLFR